VRAPREFALGIDAEPAKPMSSAARISAASIALRDGDRPLGVVDLGGEAVRGGLLVRCAASGLPLATIDSDHPRLNLALARTNCAGVETGAIAKPPPGEANFRASLVGRKTGREVPSSATLPELKNALRRWGYVRDK